MKASSPKGRGTRKKAPSPKGRRKNTSSTGLRSSKMTPLTTALSLIFVVVVAIAGAYIYQAANAAGGGNQIQAIKSKLGNYCMNSQNGNGNIGNPVNITTCDGRTGEHWVLTGEKLEYTGLASNHCARPAANKFIEKNGMVIGDCSATASEHWTKTGWGGIQAPYTSSTPPHKKLCLTVPSGNTGNSPQIQIRDCASSNTDQKWAQVSITQDIYKNPMRSASYSRGRIDQGVDFSGSGGTVYPVGNGVVVGVWDPSSANWDGGWFTEYRLTDGKAKGKYIYVAEDCAPYSNIQSGKTKNLTTNTPLCRMYSGTTGIEMGWAAHDGTLAMAHSEYREGWATSYGKNFSQMLGSIGGPTGIIGGPHGSTGDDGRTVPASWPHW